MSVSSASRSPASSLMSSELPTDQYLTIPVSAWEELFEENRRLKGDKEWMARQLAAMRQAGLRMAAELAQHDVLCKHKEERRV